MKNKKWFLFVLLYLGGVIISLSQLKITPIQSEIHESLKFSYTQISWLMSIFTFAGVFLAIPGGTLVPKFGCKRLLLYLMLFTAVGNSLGYFANSYWLLFFSRIIEGIAFALIIMLGIVLINNWFEDSQKGIAIGLWGTFSAVGSLFSMNLFLPLTKEFGLKSPWILIATLALIMFILYTLFIPKDQKSTSIFNSSNSHLLSDILKKREIYLLALAQGCMAFVLFTFINLYPIIYKDVYHLSQITSNQLTGYFGLFGIPFGAVAGYLIDKTKKSSVITICSFLFMFLGVVLIFKLTNYPSFLIQSLVLSAGASLSSACVMIIAPKYIRDKELISTGISVINLFYYIAIVIGTPIISGIVSISGNWTMSLITLSIISLMGLICVLMLKKIYS